MPAYYKCPLPGNSLQKSIPRKQRNGMPNCITAYFHPSVTFIYDEIDSQPVHLRFLLPALNHSLLFVRHHLIRCTGCHNSLCSLAVAIGPRQLHVETHIPYILVLYCRRNAKLKAIIAILFARKAYSFAVKKPVRFPC
jgi:hypothetical protein